MAPPLHIHLALLVSVDEQAIFVDVAQHIFRLSAELDLGALSELKRRMRLLAEGASVQGRNLTIAQIECLCQQPKTTQDWTAKACNVFFLACKQMGEGEAKMRPIVASTLKKAKEYVRGILPLRSERRLSRSERCHLLYLCSHVFLVRQHYLLKADVEDAAELHQLVKLMEPFQAEFDAECALEFAMMCEFDIHTSHGATRSRQLLELVAASEQNLRSKVEKAKERQMPLSSWSMHKLAHTCACLAMWHVATRWRDQREMISSDELN